MKENMKTPIDKADGTIIESMSEFSEMSGNNIRFKTLENVVEF